MSGARIRRGRFAGDNFTKLHNNVFRGGHLKPNDIAVLGHVASHMTGFETSQARIAKSMQIGLNTVKAAMARLQQHGYVIHGQDRNPDGTLGAPWYYVTDRPAQLLEIGITDPEQVRSIVRGELKEWLAERELELRPQLEVVDDPDTATG